MENALAMDLDVSTLAEKTETLGCKFGIKLRIKRHRSRGFLFKSFDSKTKMAVCKTLKYV